MSLETKILNALAEKPLPGMELAEKLDRRFLFVIPARMPPYYLLRKMESRGLITSYFDEKRLPERGGARRRFYALTTAGRELMRSDRNV